MIVCICKRVSEKKIRKAIAQGAHTVPAITATCGAGGGCGTCKGELQRMLAANAECEASAAKASLTTGPLLQILPNLLYNQRKISPAT